MKSSIYQRSGKLLFQKYREFLLPTILASIASSMTIIADSIIVGNMLGSKQMASVNLCLPVMQFLITFALLIGMGSATLIATAIGQQNIHNASKIFTTAIIVTVLGGLIIATGAASFLNTIATILTTDSELLPFVRDYLYVISQGCVVMILVVTLTFMIRTDGMVKLASLILISANVINLIFNLLFIGVFQMGIAGSALATICGYAFGLLMSVGYWKSKKRTLRLNLSLLGGIKGLFTTVLSIAKGGLPGALSSTLIVVKVFSINLLVGIIAGSDGLIVFSVCFSSLAFMSMFISGTAGTMMPILGVLYGQKDFRGVRLIFGYSLRIALTLTVTAVTLFGIFPTHVFALFGVTSPELLNLGVPSFILFAISLIGLTITYTMVYYYMTIHRHGIANLLSIIEGVVLVVPMAWLLSYIYGINGISTGFIVAEIASIAILYLITKQHTRKSKGRYNDMLLIDYSEPGVLYDVSLAGSKEHAAKLSSEVQAVLKNSGLSNSNALQIGIAIEEMVDHAQENNKKVDIDVMIMESTENIVISIRDNGWFNPLDHVETELQTPINGITLLKKLDADIKYSRVLNLNQTHIVIEKR